ncbi:MAG: hypothetical protein PHC51_09825 [bacterium]|nr:hypothetical protein [bacterium]
MFNIDDIDDDLNFSLSEEEKKSISVLVVDESAGERGVLRLALNNLGFTPVRDAGNFAQALEQLSAENYTHLLFSTKSGHEASLAFLRQSLELREAIIAIPVAKTAATNEVFNMIRFGARGYLLQPFSSDSLNRTFNIATKAEPVPELVNALQHSTKAFAQITANCLDKLVQALNDDKNKRSYEDILDLRRTMKQVALLGQSLSHLGYNDFVKHVNSSFMEISRKRRSRLGILRTKLEQERNSRI